MPPKKRAESKEAKARRLRSRKRELEDTDESSEGDEEELGRTPTATEKAEARRALERPPAKTPVKKNGPKKSEGPFKEEVIDVDVPEWHPRLCPLKRGDVVYNRRVPCICGTEDPDTYFPISHVPACKASMIHWAIQQVVYADWENARNRAVIHTKGGPLPVELSDFSPFQMWDPMHFKVYEGWSSGFPYVTKGTDEEKKGIAKAVVAAEEGRFFSTSTYTHHSVVESTLRYYSLDEYPELLQPSGLKWRPPVVRTQEPFHRARPAWKPRDLYFVEALARAASRLDRPFSVMTPGTVYALGSPRGMCVADENGKSIASDGLLRWCLVEDYHLFERKEKGSESPSAEGGEEAGSDAPPAPSRKPYLSEGDWKGVLREKLEQLRDAALEEEKKALEFFALPHRKEPRADSIAASPPEEETPALGMGSDDEGAGEVDGVEARWVAQVERKKKRRMSGSSSGPRPAPKSAGKSSAAKKARTK